MREKGEREMYRERGSWKDRERDIVRQTERYRDKDRETERDRERERETKRKETKTESWRDEQRLIINSPFLNLENFFYLTLPLGK